MIKLYKIEIYLIMGIFLTLYACSSAIEELIRRWSSEDAYSHAPLLILLSLYIIFDHRLRLKSSTPNKQWLGYFLILFALTLYILGELSALFLASHYSIAITLIGLFFCAYGLDNCKTLWPALVLIIFSIPLPYFLESSLTANLQLLSSYIGVAIIKLFSVPAFLEGNVIDLGVMKLQVVEACAGLRYLFSLMSFGFICAYLYHVQTWKRLFIFFSTIPITILMNSLRIAVGGILVNHIGVSMAEGFIHNFQGLSVFIICLTILFIEMWLLTKIGSKKVEFRSVFGLDLSTTNQVVTNKFTKNSSTRPILFSITTIGICIFLIQHVENRQETIPKHTPLASFPLKMGQWTGYNVPINSEVLQQLQLDDYLQTNYHHSQSPIPVIFYTAYYQSQRKGISPHSPKVCIPGGGWEISDISSESFELGPENIAVHYYRAIIKKGDNKQLVYYWFQQRGRYLANEYSVKWYLLLDSILMNRSDGALVRLVTPIISDEKIELADKRLMSFSNEVASQLKYYLPN